MGRTVWSLWICVGFCLFPSSLGEEPVPWKIYNSTYLYYTASFNERNVSRLPEDLTHLAVPNSGFQNITAGTFSELKKLQMLNLSYNFIESIEEGAFSHLKDLTDLSLAVNAPFVESGGDCQSKGLALNGKVFEGLQSLILLDLSLIGLPAVTRELFANLSSLENLSLAQNCFCDSDLENDSFIDLVSLKVLDLSYANITFIPSGWFSSLKKLQVLQIRASRLLEMPNEALAPLINLQELHLAGNFTEVNFGEEFQNLTNLQTLSVKGCYPQNPLEYYCSPVVLHSTCNLRVKTFEFVQDLGLNASSLEQFLSSLPVPSMNKLVLNWVDASRSSSSVQKFKACTNNDSDLAYITHLDLSHTNLDKLIYNFSSLTGLKVLNLSHNKLSTIKNSSFQGLQNLEELDLSSNSLSAIPVLYALKSLETLRLSNNELYRVFEPSTFSALPKLRRLYLDQTTITEVSLEPLKGSDITELDISNNHFKLFAKLVTILANLTSLETLNLSGNDFVNVNLMSQGEELSLASLKNLKHLYLNGCPIRWSMLTSVNHSLQELYLENIPNAEFIIESWKSNNLRFDSLTNLSLQGNQISKLSGTMLSTMRKLRYVNLQGNKLEELNRDAFENVTALEKLDVSRNFIKHITGSWKMKKLRTVDLSRNMLSVVNEDFFHNYPLDALEILDLSHNPFGCDCELAWFRNWMAEDKEILLYDSDRYRCSQEANDVKIIYLREFNTSVQPCGAESMVTLIAALVCVGVIISLIIAIMLYNRWYVRYAVFYIKCKVRGYRQVIEGEMKKYDAFISYNSDDQSWVHRTLVPHLESKSGLHVCVDYKNFIPGKYIIDNIMDSIQESRKTILVLTPNFVKSEWCYFEMEMALHRLFEEGRDVVILVLLEPIASRDLPRRLRKMFTKKTYIEWPKEDCPTARELFWAKLEHAVSVPSKVDRIHNL